mgnify:CR=1
MENTNTHNRELAISILHSLFADGMTPVPYDKDGHLFSEHIQRVEKALSQRHRTGR